MLGKRMFYFAELVVFYWLIPLSRNQDIYSYDVEQSKGHTGNNIVTVLMNENGTSLQETADFIGDHCKGLVEKYISAKKQLSPSLGKDAAKFIDALGSWMIGNLV